MRWVQKSTRIVSPKTSLVSKVPLLIKPSPTNLEGLPPSQPLLAFHVRGPVSDFTWGTPKVLNQQGPAGPLLELPKPNN